MYVLAAISASHMTIQRFRPFRDEGTGTANTALGDLYTFGSPRVGRTDFAADLRAAVQQPFGSSWQIVNEKDPVAQLPLLILGFRHVDALYRIFPNKPPAAGSSEIGAGIPVSWPGSISQHCA